MPRRSTHTPSHPTRSGVRFVLNLFALLLVLGPALGAAKPEAGKASKPVPGLYAATFGRSGADYLYVQYWSKGTLFRSETVVAGHPIVTIVNGSAYYMYDTLTKLGYVVTRSAHTQAMDAKRQRPFANDLDILKEDGGELIRSEALNGVPVDVYRVTNDQGRRTLWVTRDERVLPLRLERFDRRTGAISRLDWLDWLPGLSIANNFFDPDASIELRRFDSYEDFLIALRKGPVAPAPPLFVDLVHTAEEKGR
jgi:outer membrane lipoprotein-sorting protein